MHGIPLHLTLLKSFVRLVWRSSTIFVADVVKSSDTVDRDILDCALGRLGLASWLRRVYIAFHCEAAGLGTDWTGSGSILQGCPLSVVLRVTSCPLGGAIWRACLVSPSRYELIIFHVLLMMLIVFLRQLSTQPSVFT